MSDVARQSTGSDDRLAALLEAMSERTRRGLPPNLDEIIRGNPDLEKDLRELWGAALFADAVARPASNTTNEPHVGQKVAAVEVGPRFVGSYELQSELGRGAMGIVYRAYQRNLDRTVAVKMLLRGDIANESDIARFRGEAEAAAKLQHPNVVPVYEVGESNGHVYFSMKFVEGTTLAKLLSSGPLSPRDAARYLIPICRAIHFAHTQSILHRDLKPSNILIDQSGIPHVSDFGLAKRLPTPDTPSNVPGLTQTGAILGTPCYMSPEQAAGSRGTVGPASDIYSLGAVLYEILTCRPPFQAATPIDTILLVLEQDPVPPRLLNRRVDRVLELICLKCLQKPADLRYSTAAQLADDLEAYLNGEPVSAQSGRFLSTISRLLSDSPNAALLQNWGLLWMWHSLVLIVLCSITNWIYLRGVTQVGAFLALWGVGLGAWATIFWFLRRRAGPVTFVERQIAHVWAASTLGSISLFGVEYLLDLPVLSLSPVLAVLGGMVFLVKAGMLSGSFYIAAVSCFATAGIMTIPAIKPFGIFLFGIVSAACFFFPGLRYYREQTRASATEVVPGSASRR